VKRSFLIPILFIGVSAVAGEAPEARIAPSLALAEEFLSSGDGSAAALEYRRIEADADPADAELRGSLLLAAADAYRADGAWERMGRVLDRAEADSAVRRTIDGELLYLRMLRSEGLREWASAAEWGETLAESRRDPAESARVSRLAAADWLLAGSPAEARRATDDPAAIAAIDRWERGSDRSPTVGGLLGLVPGLGYAYSGEWGSALRSIVLNGLFGWAMYECADHDEWGLFAVTTFFELTWYTGSIYGGVDAAHRYNRERLEDAARDIRGDAPAPALRRAPAVELFRVRLAF
jgi:hypothetical protein